MSSLLAFAYKSKKNNTLFQQVKSEVPDITPAVSGDSLLSPTVSMMEEVSVVSPPGTPLGLRPRASIQQIRKDLGIPILLPLTEQVSTSFRGGLPLLPPRLPREHQNSPQVSNSSFYSKSSSFERIAESPNLRAPTTAVGALVASARGVSFATNQEQHKPSLPPRHDWLMDDNNNNNNNMPHHGHREHHQVHHHVHYQRLEDEFDAMDDYEFDDNTNNSSYQQQSYQQHFWPQQEQQHFSTKAMEDEPRHFWPQEQEQQSFSSQASLVMEEPRRGGGGYNFDPILQLNVSAISAQDTLHSLEGAAATTTQGDQSSLRSSSLEQEEEQPTRKRWNQKSNKERLVLDCIERMMGDDDVVEELRQGPERTSMHEEGLLTGFSEKHVHHLKAYITSTLREMDTFVLTPGRLDGDYGETRSELKQALEFVLKLLDMESNAAAGWEMKYEIRAALGMSSLPSSPEITLRGGDTSLFSLPDDTMTPHTSNVSMTTTITSKPPSPDSIKKQMEILNTLEKEDTLRKTMEILCTLVQKMTTACHLLLDLKISTKSIRLTDDLTHLYLSIMKLTNDDLIIVSDAFYQVMPLIRTVSIEVDDDDEAPKANTSFGLNLLGAFDDSFVMSSNRIIEQDDDDDDLRYSKNDTRDEAAADEREACQSFYQRIAI